MTCCVRGPERRRPRGQAEFYGQFLGLHGRVSALTRTVTCGTLDRKVCFFLNHVQSIELATGGLQSSYRCLKEDQRKLDAPELNLVCQRKGVEYLLTKFIFN